MSFANECYDRYIANAGTLNPAFRDDLELLGKHFFQLGQLESIFINQLIDWGRFTSIPNVGHIAVADMLCSGAVSLGVSTNYDLLIEAAAKQLGETDFFSSLSTLELNVPNRPHRPLLKLHGCSLRSRNETVWCTDQLATPPIQARIQQLSGWLQANTVGRDFIFLGFWSDWAYLNQVLINAVHSVPVPPVVVLVDPGTSAELQTKAPALWTWASASPHFFHERVTAEAFLNEVREILSKQFFRRLFARGTALFHNLNGAPPGTPMPNPTVSLDRWYDVRRDLVGSTRAEPVRESNPTPHIDNAGRALVELNERGVTLTDAGFVAPSGKTVRVVGTVGPLSAVKLKYMKESPALQTEDVVICACATPDVGVTSVLRPLSPKTVVRPGLHGTWATLDDGIAMI